MSVRQFTLCVTLLWMVNRALSFVLSFQSRIDDCLKQMADLLYQIKGPVNSNSRNTIEADSDNVLRPLMDFLDGK